MTAFERAGWTAADKTEEDRWHNERLLVSQITLKGRVLMAHRWLHRDLVRLEVNRLDYDGQALRFGEDYEPESDLPDSVIL